MFGTFIALTHRDAEAHVRDLLAEAERQRSVTIALETRPRTGRAGIAQVQAGVAALFLRAGSWLMPDEMPDASPHPVAFGLRTGQ